MNLQDIFNLLFGTGFLATLSGWIFERKKRKAETRTIETNNEASQIENAKNLLSYYEDLIEKMGERALKIEERANQNEEKFLKAIEQLKQATEQLEKARKTIKELESTIEGLTTELMKYKQLNGKAK